MLVVKKLGGTAVTWVPYFFNFPMFDTKVLSSCRNSNLYPETFKNFTKNPSEDQGPPIATKERCSMYYRLRFEDKHGLLYRVSTFNSRMNSADIHSIECRDSRS